MHVENEVLVAKSTVINSIDRLVGKAINKLFGQGVIAWPFQHAYVTCIALGTFRHCADVRKIHILPQATLFIPYDARSRSTRIQSSKGREGAKPIIAPSQAHSLSIRSKEDANSWIDLAFDGGGKVDGQTYSIKECYEQALSIHPLNADTWHDLGNEGGGDVNGQRYSVEQCYAKTLSLKPEDAAAWASFGTVAGGEVDGQRYSEKECYEKALEYDPTDAMAWSSLGALGGCEIGGQAYSKSECYKRARLLPFLGMENEETWYGAGIDAEDGPTCETPPYCKDTEVSDAREKHEIEKVLSVDPTDAVAWFNLGTFGGGEAGGETHSERDCYQQALSLNPEDADTWHNLGSEGGGDVAGHFYSVEGCYEKALSLNPEDALFWSNLGSVVGGEVNGQRYSEKRCYENALFLDPALAVAWSNLANVGGGEVGGLEYSARDCYEKAKDGSTGVREQELILQHRIADLAIVHPPESYALHLGEEDRHAFVHVKRLLDTEMINAIHDSFRSSGVQPLADRKSTLIYKHDAYPIGLTLRSHALDLYERLCGIMKWTDATFWTALKKLPKGVVSLAFEYIVYDARNGTHGTISPHVDNNSAVTMIILLSSTEHFEGGINCFGSVDQPRCLQLQEGDAVVFRGEELMHWITPVTSGLRIILQVEFSNF